MILWSEEVTSLENAGLKELVRGQRQSPDDVIIGTEIMKSSIFIPKDLKVHGSVTDDLAVGLDPCPRRVGLD